MYLLIGIPLVLFVSIIQTTIVSKLVFENGLANLLLVTVIIWGMHDRQKGSWMIAITSGILLTLYSAVPIGTYLFVFLVLNAVVTFIQKRIWKIQFLVLITLIIFGTLLEHFSTMISLMLSGVSISVADSFAVIIIPSVILNLVWAIPLYWILHMVLRRLFPEPEEA